MDDNSSQGAISKQAQAAMILKERKANNAWHKFQRNKSAMVGLVIVVIMVLIGAFAPLIATHDPYASLAELCMARA